MRNLLTSAAIAGILALSFTSVSTAQQTAAIDPSQLSPATSQQAPASITGLIDICAPVIDAQYKDPAVRRGECVNPTGAFLDAEKVNTDPSKMGDLVADTVTALVKLYRPQDCVKHRTELPDAIHLAESYTTDPVQIKALKQIEQALLACQDIETGAIASANTVSTSTPGTP